MGRGGVLVRTAAPSDAAGRSRLSSTAALASSVHAGQTRKGTDIPYISHLLAVAALVLEHGGDQEQAVAGLPHDAIEDCGAEQEVVIEEKFGPRVARMVRACTDADTFPKPPWRERKERHLRRLEAVEPGALLVSCCDKPRNARAIVSDLHAHGLALFDRFNAPQQGTLWCYGALAGLFLRRLPGPPSRELAAAVAEMRRLAPGLAAPAPTSRSLRADASPRSAPRQRERCGREPARELAGRPSGTRWRPKAPLFEADASWWPTQTVAATTPVKERGKEPSPATQNKRLDFLA